MIEISPPMSLDTLEHMDSKSRARVRVRELFVCRNNASKNVLFTHRWNLTDWASFTQQISQDYRLWSAHDLVP